MRARKPRPAPPVDILDSQISNRAYQLLSPPTFSVFIEGRPVSQNHMYGTSGKVSYDRATGKSRGRMRFYTDEAQTWFDLVVYHVHNTLVQPDGMSLKAYRLPLLVYCTYINCVGDADNKQKLTLDAVKAAIGIDDKHYRPFADAVKLPGYAQGCYIKLWQLGEFYKNMA